MYRNMCFILRSTENQMAPSRYLPYKRKMCIPPTQLTRFTVTMHCKLK